MKSDSSIECSIPQQRLGKSIKDKMASIMVMTMVSVAIANGLLCEGFAAKSQEPTVRKEMSSSLRERIVSTYSRLPVTLVENRGQTDKQVRFVVQGSHYAFFLTR